MQFWRLRRAFEETPVFLFLAVSLCLVYVAQLVAFWVWNNGWLQDTLALSAQGWRAGRWWQLVTYGWIHSETLFIHILCNLLLIAFVGPPLERTLGSWRFLGLYLAGLVGAGLTWLAWDGWRTDASVGGASGAAFALLGAAAALWPHWPVRALVLFVIPISCRMATLFWGLVVVELAMRLGGVLPFIGHSAHLGGAAVGFVWGRWAARRQ